MTRRGAPGLVALVVPCRAAPAVGDRTRPAPRPFWRKIPAWGFFLGLCQALLSMDEAIERRALLPETRRTFLTGIEKAHSVELRRFLALRLRNSADVPDLVQEVYLRLLRLKNHEAIRNPQAYLYTIASHVLYQYALRGARAPETMDPLDVVNALQTAPADDPVEAVDVERRLESLARALETHSPRAYAALVMYRCEGLTLKQIGERLGVSSVMARKYLARAVKFCDQHLHDDHQG